MSRETYNLTVAHRDGVVRAKTLRRKGLLPLVLYGRGVDALSLAVEQAVFERLLQAAGQSSIVMMVIEGAGEERPVLIQDVQYDAVNDRPIHADLYQVRMDEAIEAEVPLLFTGEAPAVKEFEGILIENIRSLRVKALPLDLPHEIEVPLGVLKKIDDALTVGEITIPSGVQILENPEVPVVTVAPPRSEEELEALEEEVDEASAIESIADVEEAKGGAEGEAEEGAAAEQEGEASSREENE